MCDSDRWEKGKRWVSEWVSVCQERKKRSAVHSATGTDERTNKKNQSARAESRGEKKKKIKIKENTKSFLFKSTQKSGTRLGGRGGRED